MEIPEKFTIAGHEVKVDILDKVEGNLYGYFSDAALTIKLARTIDAQCEGLIKLTPIQIQNTFLHEMVHAMQFFAGEKYDEEKAQVYANFLQEIINSTNKPF